MSEHSATSRKRVSVPMVGLWSLPLVLLIGAAVIGYQIWRHSQMLPLPAATDIQRIGFGINLGWTKAEWHNLPLATGNALSRSVS